MVQNVDLALNFNGTVVLSSQYWLKNIVSLALAVLF